MHVLDVIQYNTDRKCFVSRYDDPDNLQNSFEVWHSAEDSYCKYTNVPSIKTAEFIGMHFVCEYLDETNGTTHVSSISKKEWLDEITENDDESSFLTLV